MIQGIPYLGENNIELKHKIINREPDEYIDISLYELVENISEKDNLIIIDNQYITWLEDLEFDYRNKVCSIVYYSYDLYKTSLKVNIKRSKADNHLEYDENNCVLVRYNYELNRIQIKLGSNLRIYNISSDKLYEYTIKSWIKSEFSLSKLYSLYRNYCYYDMKTEFSSHEGGYTYILKQLNSFKNKDAKFRNEFKLKTWKEKPISNNYNDVRVYEYFSYINKIGNSEIEISMKLFKYRRLDFESYLFCCMQEGIEPVDSSEDWNRLGKSLHYIKISDGKLPLFIKCEWLNTNNMINTATWRK